MNIEVQEKMAALKIINKSSIYQEMQEKTPYTYREWCSFYSNNKLRRMGLPMFKKKSRKVIRKTITPLFMIIDETMDNILYSQWKDSDFIGKFVETRSIER